VNGFRNYQNVIQTRARRGDSTGCVPRDPEQIRALFSQMVRQAWTPAEIDILHRAANSALL
jgi:hypothetical protein